MKTRSRTLHPIATIAGMKVWSKATRAAGKTIGLVPTLGGLHDGHLSLVQRSLATCDATVVSVFVNPTQFGPGEDFDRYPRDLESDRRKLEAAGVAVMFHPSVEAMYPRGYKTFVDVEAITDALCGKSRPGFFRGVATVVLKLFNIVQPHQAFFGEKDFQQLAVVETLVRDLNLDVSLVRLPIFREPDGLAMSTRNLYLSPAERKSARVLSRALEEAQQRVRRGEQSCDQLRTRLRNRIESENHAQVDYVSICDPETFREKDHVGDRALIALAVRIGQTRLIDNCLVRSFECSESC
ncbi:MAG: pantoate--beta-alanine ligase [Nitrospinaceae bacterium]|nr:pantoate--beta-alanine ligase [Nitrospinaceae bacterium]NIR56474.1 pantoate--beta-alanine ligase [Nitrospinaceae bacterium]NIS86935.1 pantoate--beta-alanine ligase [Nitrospinaceae bacterium]NIT83773.1 pantoate--beta-alanine ligase [Nitrospinaceae bacterium]NIU45976.1 pantoate--beta-alanine ligase [Nitrospinaceae bacterium]